MGHILTFRLVLNALHCGLRLYLRGTNMWPYLVSKHWQYLLGCIIQRCILQFDSSGCSLVRQSHTQHTLLMLLFDGAQLYQSKQSNCWIYIWVLLDLTPDWPDLWYKKKYIIPGGFVPGPKKPKNLDLFVYTGLHHLSVLQRDGLCIWDCSMRCVFMLRLFFFLGTADGPGLSALHGQAGHHSVYGCCKYCGLRGQHKPGLLITTPLFSSLWTMTMMDVTMPMSMYMCFWMHLVFYILKTLLKLLPVRLMPSLDPRGGRLVCVSPVSFLVCHRRTPLYFLSAWQSIFW